MLLATEHIEAVDMSLQGKVRPTRSRSPRRRSGTSTSEDSDADAPMSVVGAKSGAERLAIASGSMGKFEVPNVKFENSMAPVNRYVRGKTKVSLQVWQVCHLAARPHWQVQEHTLKHQFPGLLRHSASIARFGDGSISVFNMQEYADNHWGALHPFPPGTRHASRYF